jgi:hypothetical protein
MDEILAPNKRPEASERASVTERVTSSEPAESKPAPEMDASEAKAKTTETNAAASAKPAPTSQAKPPDHDDEEDEGNVPDNLDGLKRALAASRGDKRKMRRQWQETKEALAKLEGRMAAMQQPAPKPAEPAKPETNPGDKFYGNPVEYIDSVEKRVLEATQARIRQYSIAQARAAHDDFDQVVGEFVREIQGTPLEQQLIAQEAQHPDPARYVYETARQYSQIRGVKSVDDLRSKIEAEVRAKVEAEYAQRNSQSPAAATQKPIPQSLAGVRANGASKPQAWSGPRSLEDILG